MTVLHDRVNILINSGTAKWARVFSSNTLLYIHNSAAKTWPVLLQPSFSSFNHKVEVSLCHVVSGHRFTVTSLTYTWHTHEYMHSFQAYPPSDSNALRGEGFQLHVLRWSIRSWGHIANISIMNCTLDPNNCLKPQRPPKQMSKCESHSAYFTKRGSCFYRLLRLRRSALWGGWQRWEMKGQGAHLPTGSCLSLLTVVWHLPLRPLIEKFSF